ncbi:MAG: oligosaccharide flippase family protein [Paludibacter sp.]|nr:oligosaccharide flippase family protein [Paludibacter sp.]
MSKELYNNITGALRNNKEVIENYFFMTVLQIFNSFFYLIIYPYLIRTLGTKGYGLYVFAISIVTFFIYFINFGFDMTGVKAIANNVNDRQKKEDVLSCIFTFKMYLELISVLVFTLIVFSVSSLRANYVIFLICFVQTFTNILFPQWYFQGIQRMKTVTFVQIGFKLFSLPFIFLLIRKPADIWLFAVILSLTNIFGGIVSMFIIRFYDKLKIHWVAVSDLKVWYHDSVPFFLSNFAGTLKEQSVIVLIGSFLGMSDVAIYDLANKIILVPRTIFASINGAIFPKIITNIKKETVKKIIKYEVLLSLCAIGCVILFGRWAVILLGGIEMVSAYPVAIILSITILSWLVVGAYIYFIFVPKNKYFFVTKNQLWALASFLVFSVVGLFFVRSAYVLASALMFSGIFEIVYCNILIKKNRLYEI